LLTDTPDILGAVFPRLATHFAGGDLADVWRDPIFFPWRGGRLLDGALGLHLRRGGLFRRAPGFGGRGRSIAAMDWAEAELALEMFMALRGCSKSSRKNPIAATSFPSHCALVFQGNFEFPKIKLTSQDVVSIFPPSGIRHNIYALPQVWNN
jgi:hypothetical protein